MTEKGSDRGDFGTLLSYRSMLNMFQKGRQADNYGRMFKMMCSLPETLEIDGSIFTDLNVWNGNSSMVTITGNLWMEKHNYEGNKKNLFQCIHSAMEMVYCLIIHKKAAVTTTEPQWKETLKIVESLPHMRKSLRSEHVLNEIQLSTAG